MTKSHLAEILEQHESDLLEEWMKRQLETFSGQRDRISESQLRVNSHDLLIAMRDAAASGNFTDVTRPEWARVRDLLATLSRQRAAQGFTPAETAIFVFSLKQPLFDRIRRLTGSDTATLADEMWAVTVLLDKLGLYTTDVFQRSREDVIIRQQQEMLELSTPVVEVWNGILAVPLIGTLDSARTQVVMQNLLQAIVDKAADLAIIDITGVPTVDTLVAQHLLKTVSAARLMGAECIISGVRPQIAQTIIHLGVDLSGVVTKATLSSALQLALRKKNAVLAM